MLDFDWSIRSYPPYLPDLAPSNFQFFISLQNAVNEKKSSQEDQVKPFVENFFSLKPTWEELRCYLMNDKRW